MTTIRFYSPVKIFGTVPYQNPLEDDGCEFFELNKKEKILCKDKINAEIKKLFSPVNFPVDKVRTASLETAVKENRLVSVLTCHCSEKLTQQEMQILRNWWGWQCWYGFGKRLKSSRIYTWKYGRLKVMLWHPDCDWSIIEE